MLCNTSKLPLTLSESQSLHVKGLHLQKRISYSLCSSYCSQFVKKRNVSLVTRIVKPEFNFNLKSKEATIASNILYYTNVNLLPNTVITEKWRHVIKKYLWFLLNCFFSLIWSWSLCKGYVKKTTTETT